MRSSSWVVLVVTVTLAAAQTQHYHKNPQRRWPTLDHLRPAVPAGRQADTVTDMIVRLLGSERAHDYLVMVNLTLHQAGRDIFIIEDDPSNVTRIRITGSSGVAAAAGFHYYAKMLAGVHFSWSGDQTATLTTPPPRVLQPIRVVMNDLFRYYQNVCTASYSFVWWNWTRWEREIDWMAINGINLPLASVGQEAIWMRVFTRLGMAHPDLEPFFTGPAFLAWNRMGNVDGWSGPLSDRFMNGQLALQHRILERMRSYGMVPVLPGFCGHVPSTIQQYYPNATVTRLSDWGGFNSTYCCTYLLDHSDPLFSLIGSGLVREMVTEFGVDHVYGCDSFNEMIPPTRKPNQVAAVGRAVFGAMVAADPDAVWLMQGWMFRDEDFWNRSMAEALLCSVPIGRMIVLDLQAELSPQYIRLDSFFGQPWIWCMLHNYGGVKGLYGSADAVNRGPFDGRAYPNSSMVGTGLTPEGIEQNDAIYELANELAYLRVPTQLDSWFAALATRRYGNSTGTSPTLGAAWTDLGRTALNCTVMTFHGAYVVNVRSSFNLRPVICYNVDDFFPIWDRFVEAATNRSSVSANNESIVSTTNELSNSAANVFRAIRSDLFMHDLVDITREAMVVVATSLHSTMFQAYTANDSTGFRNASIRLLDLLSDLDDLLATDRRFLLGPWLESARALAGSDNGQADLNEYNARLQITLWGTGGQLVDYAAKQWSGLLRDYYRPRWCLFVDHVQLALDSGVPFRQAQFNADVLEQIELPFVRDIGTRYPPEPFGDPAATARRLHLKWQSSYPTDSSIRVDPSDNQLSSIVFR